MKKISLAVLPGDGIGPEVTLAAVPVFDALNVPVEMSFGDIGWECWKREGTPIPDRTWELIRSASATLLGAITSKPEREALGKQGEGQFVVLVTKRGGQRLVEGFVGAVQFG